MNKIKLLILLITIFALVTGCGNNTKQVINDMSKVNQGAMQSSKPIDEKSTSMEQNSSANNSIDSEALNTHQESFFGRWVIKKLIAYGPVGTYSSTDIKDTLGRELSFSADKATCFGDRINDLDKVAVNPVYKKTVISRNDFATGYRYRLTFDNLGINNDSIIKVYATDSNNNGCLFYIKDNNDLILYGGGAFFQLDRVEIKQQLSKDSAELIIEKYLKPNGKMGSDPNLVFAYDHDQKSDEGKDYYVFHVFDNMIDHEATIGWYGVEKETGQLYDFISNKPLAISLNENVGSNKSNTDNIGNTDVNYVNGEQVAKIGDCIYYIDSSDFCLYKLNIKTSDKIKLTDDKYPSSVKVVGDWVYYINYDIVNGEQFTIFKVKNDGTNKIQIIGDNSGKIYVVGDYIYYINYMYTHGEEGLYRVKTDGSGKTKITDSLLNYIMNEVNDHIMNIKDGWIYYLSEDGIQYRISADGTKNEKLDNNP